MLVLLVFLVLVPPLPVLALFLIFEPLEVDVRFVSLFQPMPIRFIFAPIPVMVVMSIAVVYSALPFFLLVPFVIILGRNHRANAHRCHQSR
jgi:hypothetical protein